jgi:hypothetical protein
MMFSLAGVSGVTLFDVIAVVAIAVVAVLVSLVLFEPGRRSVSASSRRSAP